MMKAISFINDVNVDHDDDDEVIWKNPKKQKSFPYERIIFQELIFF